MPSTVMARSVPWSRLKPRRKYWLALPARGLSKRLVRNFHGHHELSLATLHVHLDDGSCMEVTALKGAASEMQHFVDHIIAECGVRYGRVVMIPTAGTRKKRASKTKHKHD